MARNREPRRPTSFSLVEMLTVIAIIAILAGLTLYSYSGVLHQSARSRARTEIGALSSAMESYKSDNGAYPTPTTPYFSSTNVYVTAQPNSPSGAYQGSSAFLYESLTGQTNYGDSPPTPASGMKIYYTFKSSQLGNNSTGAGAPIYLKDPFGNSYGYFNGNGSNPPVNGANQFDLWSTAGDTAGTNAPGWVTDWSQ